MERYASSLKMKELKRLAQEKQYLKAMKILETLNVDKIRSMSDLSVIAEILIQNDEYEYAMEILLRIYEKSCTRRIVEQLIDLSIRMKNMEETKEFYKEYLRIAPRDPYRLVLRYRIEKADHMPYENRIKTLELLKQEDYMEEWAYELAKLYHKTGQVDKCVEECSDIILWFGQGIVVEKARLLKEHYTSGFNITDNLKAGEFDATRSLEEVIRQVKQQRGVSQPVSVVGEETKPIRIIPKLVEESKEVAEDWKLVEESMEVEEDLKLVEESSEVAEDWKLVEESLAVEEDLKLVEESTEVNEGWNLADESKFIEEAPKLVREVQYKDEVHFEEDVHSVEEESNQEEETKQEEESMLAEDVSYQVQQPVKQASEVTLEETNYVLTPDVIKEVKARVNKPNSECIKDIEYKQEAEQEDEREVETILESVAVEDEDLQKKASIATEIKETTKEVDTNTLTEKELQKMKERMRQLQDTDIAKRYSHDSQDIYDDGENTYAFGINLSTIFQNFITINSIKKQLLSILENMDNNKKENNFMICGDIQTGKTSLARSIAIAMWKLNRISTKKVAKISASKLNQINLIDKMEQLENGSLVIENASTLSSATVESIIQMIKHFDGRILVLFEDNPRDMEELMMREESLRKFFTHRIIIPRYNAHDVIGFAYSMLKQQEYEVEEEAKLHFEEKVEQIFRATPQPEQLKRVKEYVGDLIKKAETRNMLLLMKQAKEGRFSQKVTNVITITDIY